MPSKSYWRDSASTPRFSALNRDLTVDVLVIGGGITGITAAYLLKQAGQSVALIERGRCAMADTACTSAHLTYVTDIRPHKLLRQLGSDHAAAVWDAGAGAIQQIETIVTDEEIECRFARIPGYLHASLSSEAHQDSKEDESAALKDDAQTANGWDFPATYLASVPVFDRPGVKFPEQGRFHPVEYLGGLLGRIAGGGCHVFEHTEATEFTADPLSVKAHGHTIHCGYVVIATHVPLQGNTNLASAALLQSKLVPYTSYVIGARVAKGTLPDALFSDTSDPYYYLRLEPRRADDYVIFGGEDHKTGQEEDPKGRFEKLEQMLHLFLPEADVRYRWSGQVIESVDGLPYIGETAEKQFVATGFAGNGLTFGTLGGMMACDAALGRKNPWTDLFPVERKKLSAAWNYVRENADYPYYMVKDRLAAAEGDSLRVLKRGEGKILTLDGQRVAAYRDPKGKVTTLNPSCTHLGCLVHWNEVDTTWDCPCHGSRFQATGACMAGPAETPLEAVGVSAGGKAKSGSAG
ncbi:MAG: FAD-dependent oxidoreductase [Planctomycetes bacterium]|nr:FAD-dependent oxidoreductase [Planctomycetota bacterium]